MTGSSHDRAKSRSNARLGAVQALYEMELAQTDLSDVISECAASGVVRGLNGEVDGGTDFGFFEDLITGIVREQHAIDPEVNAMLAENWHLTRLDSILRAILRAGTYELAHRPDVPAKVVIDEYLNIAHAFFEQEEPKFVNGVLDKLARKLRASELQA